MNIITVATRANKKGLKKSIKPLVLFFIINLLIDKFFLPIIGL